MTMGQSTSNLLKAGLVKEQFSRLDKDLALYVAFSGLSLNPDKVFKTVQLMAHIQMLRTLEKDIKMTPKEKLEFETTSQRILPETYLDRTLKPQ